MPVSIAPARGTQCHLPPDARAGTIGLGDHLPPRGGDGMVGLGDQGIYSSAACVGSRNSRYSAAAP
ncbi:hypothetical protein EJ571_20770 [Mycobacteroides franklinii]|uniref:Uncharacterized protein n=1 Tax=Mycobacteroides franklinii TaxID=948102 RepID=A0A4R5P6F3_9MYCO|nr:hypothetical protein EJ571_20770 [Mycobacteroides franklinii]